MGFAYENALRHLGLLHSCNMRLFSENDVRFLDEFVAAD